MVTTHSSRARALPRLFCLVSSRDDLDLLPALARAGVGGFQVREKHPDDDRSLLALVGRVRELVAPSGATVVVDDRLDLALAAGADGVHLGAGDLPVAAARAIADAVRPGFVVGATCRSADDVRAAAADGADYAGFGPLFATTSKTGLPEPRGLDALGAAADGAPLPLVGIGGVDPGNAAAVRAAGAHGVAVIGGIWHHPDPPSAAEALVRAVR